MKIIEQCSTRGRRFWIEGKKIVLLRSTQLFQVEFTVQQNPSKVTGDRNKRFGIGEKKLSTNVS